MIHTFLKIINANVKSKLPRLGFEIGSLCPLLTKTTIRNWHLLLKLMISKANKISARHYDRNITNLFERLVIFTRFALILIVFASLHIQG